MRMSHKDKLMEWAATVDRPGTFRVVDEQGQLVGSLSVNVVSRQPEPMPEDFNVETERRRLKAGGCCGQPVVD